MNRLDGRVAIVTGASSGIGASVAMSLAQEGASVVLAARREQTLRKTKERLDAHGTRSAVITTDVRSRDAVERLVAESVEHFGRLDIMINNAGVGHWEPTGIATGDPDQWLDELEVNLLGVMWGTHAAARVLVEQGHGDIVNVSSLAGRGHSGDVPGYVTSKHGVHAFTYSALRDLRPAGVRVTLIEPGAVATPMQPEEEMGAVPMLAAEDVARAIVFAVTQPRSVCLPNIALVPMPDPNGSSA